MHQSFRVSENAGRHCQITLYASETFLGKYTGEGSHPSLMHALVNIFRYRTFWLSEIKNDCSHPLRESSSHPLAERKTRGVGTSRGAVLEADLKI
jgi:hypothetical protein